MSPLDELLEENGGAYPLDASKGEPDASLATLLSVLRDEARIRLSRRATTSKYNISIDVALIDSGELNAFATKKNEFYLIGINIGTLCIFKELFDRIFSNPHLFNQIGDISKEDCVEFFAAETDVVNLRETLYRNHYFNPKDTIRRKYAGELFSLAVRFIFLHEFGHIFNGHVAWLQKDLGISVLRERNDVLERGLTYLDLQTLEMDADCFAVHILEIEALEGIVQLENWPLIRPGLDACKLGSELAA